MKDINRILLQFYRAVLCANSKYPQDKALAVILFDNLIELQLYKRAEKLFMIDRATWYGGSRAISTKKRQNIIGKNGKYNRLLKFSKDGSLLTEQELVTIKFVHEIRNSVYHRGGDDEVKIELALLIYFSFLKRKLKDWGSPNGLVAFMRGAAYEKIEFGQSIQLQSKEEFILDYKKYFENTLDYLFSTWQLSEKLDEKAIELISKQIRSIKSNLLFVRTNAKDLNYYATLEYHWAINNLFSEYEKHGRKPKNLESILLITLYIRLHKDQLEDIDDLQIRQKRGRILLYKHRKKYKGKYPFWTDIEIIQQRVDNLKGKPEHIIIENLIDIQSKLNNLYQDISEAASNFDGYVQDLSDRIH